MIKQRPIDIATTNIASLGSEADQKLRQSAAKKEAHWVNAGKKPGIEIWRIENFNVVEWAKSKYGTFCNGDSYIILNTYKKNASSDKLSWNIHFWLGENTSTQKAGTAAYKTVELDDCTLRFIQYLELNVVLGGAPVQYREYESAAFLALFPHYVILEGGVDSGFHHNEPEKYRTRLYHVRGNKKHIAIHEVPLTFKSMNITDVFILDAGLEIYQWNGSKSSPFEKNKAAEFCRKVDSERNGLATVIVHEENDESDKFWSTLGGKGPISPVDVFPVDQFDKADVKLTRLSDASGTLEFKLVATKQLEKKMLLSGDVHVLDTGVELYVWTGKGSSEQEKKRSLEFAQKYVQDNKLSPFIPVVRLFEGHENELFLSYFK